MSEKTSKRTREKKSKKKTSQEKNVRKKYAIFEKCFEKTGHEKYTVYKKNRSEIAKKTLFIKKESKNNRI